MQTTLYSVMRSINRYFHGPQVEHGEFEIKDGELVLKTFAPLKGQYLRILGSILNDGVYLVGGDSLGYTVKLDGAQDEKWKGAVVGLVVPQDFLATVESIVKMEIKKQENKDPTVTHESWSDYSKTVATNSKGLPATWRDVYSVELEPFNRMSDIETPAVMGAVAGNYIPYAFRWERDME